MKILLCLLIFLIGMVINAQPTLLIEGIDSTLTSNQGYVIPRSVPTFLTFRNNSIISNFSTGFVLRCGDDSFGEGNYNNLDNAVIIGNKLISTGGGTVHGIMAGYNINYDIRYNYIEGSNYVVFEGGYNDGTNMINTSGGFSYNIFKNNRLYTFGYDGVYIYNNTFYSSQSGSTLDNYLIRVTSNNQLDITVPSKNIKIKNNIFYSVYDNYAIVFMNDKDSVGFECDYNVYYWDGETDNEPKFFIGGTKTWAQWRALGYDTHSVIIDPKFIDNIRFVPSVKLDCGVNIGEIHSTNRFDYGLSPKVDWIVGKPPDTITQNGIWQVGAIIFNENKTSDIINNNDSSNLINLYPNPTDGIFTANLLTSYLLPNETSIKISTLKGGTVFSGILLKDENTRQFDVSNFDSGVYLLIISSNQHVISKKFIKR